MTTHNNDEAAAWADGPMLALDVETTGVDPETARIVSAAVAAVGGGTPPETTTWLINPGTEIPAEATAIHRITTDRVRADGRAPAEALAEIIAALAEPLSAGFPLVVFRAPYALTVLARECARHGVAFVDGEIAPVIDPSVLDKAMDRYRRGRRTLPALCEHYQVRHDGPNDAEQDALAAARLAWRLPRVHPQLATLPLAELHARERAWAAEQAVSLRAHLRRTDPGAVVSTDWPLIPSTTQE
ncbi:exonuclease domain-containing protein [Streptomyces daghestanicus]|uniref:3'-5' exonuclease n=1 Tax=Streptomyces daghestanicus TaxID=66885 RepID=A0ABQ3Q2S6_9ACTN|nr:exonuclease domain-containing protein [Streptomyces daghestanicus]GGU20640.1 3'-5' exonuclease [Streptomyces daghestanicus]GHI31582.1 3'-5' exonuclease [Streptomyces daghestanicus]